MVQPRWQVDPERVMSEILDGEAVIIDLASGRYHATAGVGATVWQTISATPGVGLDQILATLGVRHTDVPDDAAEQVGRFLGQLVGAGIATEEPGAPGPEPVEPASGVVSAWSAPVLESHDDLEDLLLLDPVHEVSEVGWPHAAPS